MPDFVKKNSIDFFAIGIYFWPKISIMPSEAPTFSARTWGLIGPRDQMLLRSLPLSRSLTFALSLCTSFLDLAKSSFKRRLCPGSPTTTHKIYVARVMNI